MGATLFGRLAGVTGDDSILNGVGDDDFEIVGVIGTSLKLGLVGAVPVSILFILLSKCSAWAKKVFARDLASSLRVWLVSSKIERIIKV